MPTSFARRHIGPNSHETQQMLKELGFSGLDDLIRNTVPNGIRLQRHLSIPHFETEEQALGALKKKLSENRVFKSYIGMGYSDTVTPAVILRNILENPGWYTQYTPYQAEIAQGRLEALLNFQTMVSDLTGLEIANASLLDEATAAAEAMHLSYSHVGDDDRNIFFVSELCHPQVIEVIQTRAEPLDIKVVIGDHRTYNFDTHVFGAVFQYPSTDGRVFDYTHAIESVHKAGALATVCADILSLVLLKTPADMGADIAVGNTQRFGVPFGYGGPHAAYFATREKFKRSVPGRIIGVSVDSQGHKAYRLALQTREQHIRREKATSNICTAQVLLAVMASMYAVYHGPEGLKEIAKRTNLRARELHEELTQLGYAVDQTPFFDTISVSVTADESTKIQQEALKHEVNLRYLNTLGARAVSSITIAVDETTTLADISKLSHIFASVLGKKPADHTTGTMSHTYQTSKDTEIPHNLKRTTEFLQHNVFNTFHSETEMLRYMYRLQSKDLSLTSSMIPLGSCTMKLNATSEMLPVTWNEVSNIHPFVPLDQAVGYQKMFDDLESWLRDVTGFAGISLQPNAGSQGEYAGLLVIRKYHHVRGEGHRNICIIPTSAHGTNPASAVMAGMKVVPVACDKQGNIDMADLRAKAQLHAANLSALMVTYPSTHGVFEESIQEICSVIHHHGGQVYMDGANMNAQIGLCRPGEFGADVCHLNLHKTFCIPHGGGGPGMGPIGVKEHLVSHLPGHKVVGLGGAQVGGAVSAAPWGSASILPISWMYIAMMGSDGLRRATEIAILNANYMAKKLNPYFPVLFKGREGLVAHECIVDLRGHQEETGVTVEDVAKRLMDYGYHAPTMSWPVAGTMMIEPTESEAKGELDRFCDALISIHGEIEKIKTGQLPRDKNMLKNAPHTAHFVLKSEWDLPYSREEAAFPSRYARDYKFWPSVSRIDNAHGDRHLVCSCPPWGEAEK